MGVMTMPKRIPGRTSAGIPTPQNEVLKRQRASLVAGLRLRGVPTADIAREMNLTARQIINITNYAVEQGLVEEVRKSMQQTLLPKVARVYEGILDADEATLADKTVQKGHELKLKAARHVADGMGVFRKQAAETASVTKSLDLQGYVALQEGREAGAALAAGSDADVAANEAVIDAESALPIDREDDGMGDT